MADPPRYPGSDDPGLGPDSGSTTGTPRWVKVSGIIALVVVLLFVVLLITRGPHGPSRHGGSGSGSHTPPAGVEHGEQQP